MAPEDKVDIEWEKPGPEIKPISEAPPPELPPEAPVPPSAAAAPEEAETLVATGEGLEAADVLLALGIVGLVVVGGVVVYYVFIK